VLSVTARAAAGPRGKGAAAAAAGSPANCAARSSSTRARQASCDDEERSELKATPCQGFLSVYLSYSMAMSVQYYRRV